MSPTLRLTTTPTLSALADHPYLLSSDLGIGYGDDTWMSFEVPLIKPLSKESYIKTLYDIYNDVVEKIESTNFRLPDGVEPLNLV